jgi:hypothetical protein
LQESSLFSAETRAIDPTWRRAQIVPRSDALHLAGRNSAVRVRTAQNDFRKIANFCHFNNDFFISSG